MNSPEKQIVLAALHEGTEIKSFQSNDSVSFHIIEGKLKFHTRKESVTLDKGQLLTLQKNIKYRMSTKEETVILLTFANGTMCQL
jgi:quercetin dioxygenase-like cupin family protein